MKTELKFIVILCLLSAHCLPAFGQGAAFTYQGQLQNSGSPASGTYNLTFALYTTNSGGSTVAGPVTNAAVNVTNGLFTVTLGFDASVWNGETNWLQIGVETNGGSSFTPLSPRQQVTPTPYAIFAEGANASGLSGTIPMSSLSGTYGDGVNFTNLGNNFTGNGAGLVGVNAAALGGLSSAAFWKTNGNAGANPTNGAFLGTRDSNPLELHVNGQRVMRLEPTASNEPNVIGGAPNNSVTTGAVAATIGGGEVNTVNGSDSTVGGGYDNSVGGIYAVIAGGFKNQANGAEATVCGGQQNVAGPQGATVAGGVLNQASGSGAFVGGGGFDGSNFSGNTASGAASTVAGGLGNQATNSYATVVGGTNNLAGNVAAFVGGGMGNTATGVGAFVGGGGFDGTSHVPNNASGEAATVGGGELNQAIGSGTFIGGGYDNSVSGLFAVVAGGFRNEANAPEATVGGGQQNVAGPQGSTVAGGVLNQASGSGSFVGGGGFDGSNFSGNTASGAAATVAGGLANLASNSYATVGGGAQNSATGFGAVVMGGSSNIAQGRFSFAGGQQAVAQMEGTFVWADANTNVFNPYALLGPQGVANSFNVRSTAGFYVATGVNSTNGEITSGVYVGAGGSGWNSLSDRNAKTHFASLDTTDLLDRLVSVPVLAWNYKSQDASVRHIGPMAQDFNAAFGVGEPDKAGERKFINSLDEEGVALAAIQGLNQKVDEKETEIRNLKRQNDSLAERLNELEATVKRLAAQK